MTTQTTHAIPQRQDISDQYKWNLADIYPSENDWEADYKKVQELIGKADGFKGRLGASAQTLFECLEIKAQISLICANLYQYARLNQDLDNRQSKYQALTERAAMLHSQAAAAWSFVEPELLTLDDRTLRSLAADFPKTDIYDFMIEELIRSRAHIRSAEVEQLLAQSAMIARGPETIFSMLDDADMKYPAIKDEKGQEVPLTRQRFARFMESSDRRVRRDANDAFMGAYKDHINCLGASLASAVNGDIFYSRARNYKSSLEMALDAHNIPMAVYKSLIETTENHLEGLHRWMALRKKILKLDELYPYDIYNPLFPEQDYEIPYDDAVRQVLEAVRPLGEKYVSVMKQGFEKRWVDVFETEGKGGGAYNSGNYLHHPFVLMNYNDTVDNMFTLAHEMGHALHSYLSSRHQHYVKSQYSTFVAEVASTLNEGFLLQYLLKKTDDPKQKLFLLNRHIDNTKGTFFHQVQFAHFELMIHAHVENGQALSPEILGQMWTDLLVKYYGPTLKVDEFAQYKWSRIPHFYMTYYVFQYATSYAASQAILDKFLSGEKGIIDKYLELISSGGNDYPINQLKKCGVDMTTPEPVLATIKLFGEQVDEVARLAGV
jgi:oligoendopeptidase F